MKNYWFLVPLIGAIFIKPVSAELVISDFDITENRIELTLTGVVDLVGPDYKNQIYIGSAGRDIDWLDTYSSFNASYGSGHTAPTILSAYSLDTPRFGEWIGTNGVINGVVADHAIGQTFDMSLVLLGSFNIEAFIDNTFDIQLGGLHPDDGGPLLQAEYIAASYSPDITLPSEPGDGLDLIDVPSPWVAGMLYFAGMLGAAARYRRA